ncbi:hypothetical protein V5O48_013854 [Marasmius crinis-equi]|uniref:Mug135-like C-terminal domain-containing protein n=1 Tax=Marasmius crinis-equi TaxID=585013 RepID=A0ABR3EYX5_9AGAR
MVNVMKTPVLPLPARLPDDPPLDPPPPPPIELDALGRIKEQDEKAAYLYGHQVTDNYFKRSFPPQGPSATSLKTALEASRFSHAVIGYNQTQDCLETLQRKMQEDLAAEEPPPWIQRMQQEMTEKIAGDVTTNVAQAVREAITPIAQRLTHLEGQLTGVQTNLEGRLTNLEGQITGVQTNLEGRLTNLEGQLTGLQTNLDRRLTGMQANLERRLARLEGQVEELREECKAAHMVVYAMNATAIRSQNLTRGRGSLEQVPLPNGAWPWDTELSYQAKRHATATRTREVKVKAPRLHNFEAVSSISEEQLAAYLTAYYGPPSPEAAWREDMSLPEKRQLLFVAIGYDCNAHPAYDS